MRRTLTVCRSGLAAAAAVVLLTACGDTGGEDDTISGSEATSAAGDAAEDAGEAVTDEFCQQASTIDADVDAFDAETDPTALPQALQDAADEIRAIEPPAEIEQDWTALADGAEQIATAISGLDFTDPAALQSFQEQVAPLQEELTSASTNVENYLRDECGLDPATESASPTS